MGTEVELSPPPGPHLGQGEPSRLLRGVSETASPSSPVSTQAVAGGTSRKELGVVTW